jgi:DNA modification methylase
MTRSSKMMAAGPGRQPVHPFPARMAPGIAFRAFAGTRRKLRVLDPMMGSGTVLVAARAKGHYAVGVDIDPLAVLISRVWTRCIDKVRAKETAKRVLLRARENFELLSVAEAYPAKADGETRRFLRYWFDPNARRQLAALASAIRKCRDLKSQDVLWCAFSRLIITKQAGVSLALDLAHSRPHRYFERAPIEPFANFLKAIDRVLDNCLASTERGRGPAPSVSLGDARQLKLPDSTIDLVLTSPPYLNAIDYLRCSKFSLIWMGSNADELRHLRKISIGTEVGEYEASQGTLSRELITRLRLKSRLSRRKQAVLSHFISDMHRAMEEVSRVLVPGGKAIYVVGENTIKGTYIQNAKIITAIAQKVGLKLKSQSRRALPPNRRYLPPPSNSKNSAALDNRMRREVILQFVKPKARRRRS